MVHDFAPSGEGELYRIFTLEDLSFEIRYGYHTDEERGRIEPLPIFPDLVSSPVYTRSGIPVTAYVQVPCRHYSPCRRNEPEEWCGDCLYYDGGRDKIGRCLCPERKRE